MPTIVDSLILQLGVKAEDFFKTQRAVSDTQKKFKEEVVKHGSEIEGSVKITTAALGAFSKTLIGLFALFTGGKEVGDFIAQITATDAALGRVAKTTGVSVDRLQAYQVLFQKQGAAAGEAIKIFNSLEVSRQQFLTRGSGPFKEIAITLSQLGVAYDAREPIEKIFLKAAAAIQKLAQTNPSLAHTYALQVTGSEAAAQALIQQGKALDAQVKDQERYTGKTKAETDAAQKRIDAWNDISAVLTSISDKVLLKFNPAFELLDEKLKHLLLTLSERGLIESFKEAWVDLVDVFNWSLVNFREADEKLRESLKGLINDLIDKLSPAFESLKTIFMEVRDAYAADWEDIKKITSDFISSLPDYANKVLEGFKGMFSSAFDWLKKSFNEIWQKIKGVTPFGEVGSATVEGSGAGAVPESTTPGTRTDQTTGARAHQAGTPGSGNIPNTSTPGWWTEERQKHAYDKLRAAGLSDMGAKGLVSRWMYVESAGGPGSVNPRGGAFGIAQWLGSRKTGIAGNKDFDAQLDYVAKELGGTEKSAGALLKSANTPEEGARAATAYERAENYEKAGHGPHEDDYTKKTLSGIGRVHVGGEKAKEPAKASEPVSVVKPKGQGDPHKPGFDPNAVEFHDYYPKKTSSLGYQTAMLGAQPAAAYHNVSAQTNSNNRTQTAETHVGVVNVHTAATDANGIARDIKPALERTARGMQANYSLA